MTFDTLYNICFALFIIPCFFPYFHMTLRELGGVPVVGLHLAVAQLGDHRGYLSQVKIVFIFLNL